MTATADVTSLVTAPHCWEPVRARLDGDEDVFDWPFVRVGPRVTVHHLGSGPGWAVDDVVRHRGGGWFVVMLVHDERCFGGQFLAPLPVLVDPIDWSAGGV